MTDLLRRVYTPDAIKSALLVAAGFVCWHIYWGTPSIAMTVLGLVCCAVSPWTSYWMDLGLASAKRRIMALRN